jgi:hypothetical protein
MARSPVDTRKRPAAAAQRGDGSEGQDSDEENSRRGSARPPPSRNKDPAKVPFLAVNKAPAPQTAAAAANASVLAADEETSKARPIGQYDSFELQMRLIEKTKPSKTTVPLPASPVKFGSPGRPKTSKVWVAGLKSGEMVAYATDRHHAENPAFIKKGLDKIRDDATLAEACMVSELIHKKADKQPFKSWAQSKVSISSQTAYTLYWFVLVRTFKNLADHTPEARIKWGVALAAYFQKTEAAKFEYGGDLSRDQACAASDFFSVQDVMEKFIIKRLGTHFSQSDAVANPHIMASYYGDDPVLNSQVIQFYGPNDQQSEEVVDQEEANANKELSDLFKK